MKNPPPKKPQVNDAWVDDNGELNIWDGTSWVPYEDPPFPQDSILDSIIRED